MYFDYHLQFSIGEVEYGKSVDYFMRVNVGSPGGLVL